MNNHIQLILMCENQLCDKSPTVGQIIGYFKYHTTKQINLEQQLWQRGYYDHIIRNEHDYQYIWKYIDENPAKWELDKYYW